MKPVEALITGELLVQKRIPSAMRIIVSDFDGIISQGHACIYKVVESYLKVAGAGEDRRLRQSFWTRPSRVALKFQLYHISRKIRADTADAVEVVQINRLTGYKHIGESMDGEIF